MFGLKDKGLYNELGCSPFFVPYRERGTRRDWKSGALFSKSRDVLAKSRDVLCERCGENERSSEYEHKTFHLKYKYSGRLVKGSYLRASARLENVTYSHWIGAFVDVCPEINGWTSIFFYACLLEAHFTFLWRLIFTPSVANFLISSLLCIFTPARWDKMQSCCS